MPLIHSKTPKAFKQNIKKMMHENVPQKQAVAIAYSEQRRAHKSHGGECRCSDCYSEGGRITSDTRRSDNEKGVHQRNHQGPGSSYAGSLSRSAVKGNTSFSKEELNDESKKEHHKVLGEMRSMKKPHGNYDEGGEVYASMDSDEDPYKEPMTEMSNEDMEDLNTPKHSELFDRISSATRKHLPEMEAEGGEVHGDEAEDKEQIDTEIHKLLGEELMSAFDAKDHKRVMEGIEAIVLSCLNKE